MLIKMRLRLRTPLLGNQQTPENVRRFVRDDAFRPPRLKVDLAQWYWAVGQAMEALGYSGLDQFAVRFEDSMQAPKLQLYVRRWSDTKRGDREQEMFESIGKGTILTFHPLLLSTQEPSQAESRRIPPTPEELRKVMSCVGDMLGLSPWGSKFGYGRFTVESLEATNEPIGLASVIEENLHAVGREFPDDDPELSGAGETSDDPGEGD